MPRSTWRQDAAKLVAESKAKGEAAGLSGMDLRRFVRACGPGRHAPSWPRKMFLEEFAREFKGKRFPARGIVPKVAPAEGQGSLFE